MEILTDTNYEQMGFITKNQYFKQKKYPQTHISDTATIGKNVNILPNVYIGDNTVVGDGSIIQYGAFIEHDCHIGKYCRIGTNAVLRRETVIGNWSIFGSLSASEGKNWIGNHVVIHTQCHITTAQIIEDYVFMAPFTLGLNDPDFLYERENTKKFVPQGPWIKFGARISGHTTLMPNAVVGRECLIGANSLVMKSIPDFSVAYGNPARVIRKIEEKMKLSPDKYIKFRNRISEEELKQVLKNIQDNYR